MDAALTRISYSKNGKQYITCSGADTYEFCSIHNPDIKGCDLKCPVMQTIIERLHEYEVEFCKLSDDYNPLTEKITLENGQSLIRCRYEDKENIHLALITTLNAFEAL